MLEVMQMVLFEDFFSWVFMKKYFLSIFSQKGILKVGYFSNFWNRMPCYSYLRMSPSHSNSYQNYLSHTKFCLLKTRVYYNIVDPSPLIAGHNRRLKSGCKFLRRSVITPKGPLLNRLNTQSKLVKNNCGGGSSWVN